MIRIYLRNIKHTNIYSHTLNSVSIRTSFSASSDRENLIKSKNVGDTALGTKSREAGITFQHNGPIDKLLRKFKSSPTDLERGADFNRYLLLPAATLNHLCLGSIFAWSVFSQPLMRVNGVLSPASSDWLLSDVTTTFTLVMGGMAWGAVFSKYLDRFGPRFCSLVGSASLFGGFSCASLAVATQSLPMLYLGGLIWGLANGWSYVPPVACVLKWFPERKGLASGLCLIGYGGGAMVAAPVFNKLLDYFKSVPQFVGHTDQVHILNQAGKLFIDAPEFGGLREVIVATKRDIHTSGFDGLCEPGVYLVGTGDSGVIETLSIFGVSYGVLMAAVALAFRLPMKGYRPAGFTSTAGDNLQKSHLITHHDVDTKVALRTPQFRLLYAGFAASITGSYGLLSCGKLILTETFSALPLVTNSFTTSFVAGMSLANLSGRLVYTNLSDYLANHSQKDPFFARQKTFQIMFALACPSYLAIVGGVHAGVGSTSLLPLLMFSASVFTILSSFGGTAATRPAIVGDLFGLKNVAPLAAIQMSAILPAAYVGPKVVTYFRESRVNSSIVELSEKVNTQQFIEAFGTTKENLQQLIEQKSISIPRLLELLPENTIDPSPFVYDSAMQLMAGLQIVALGCNFLLKPVPEHLYEESKTVPPKATMTNS